MVVWGGATGPTRFATGAVFDTATNTWTATAAAGAPSQRDGHTAVWTGTRMIVWGGHDGSNTLNTGGIYDPASNAWSPISTAGAPQARYTHVATWTGTRMLIWGGNSTPSGPLLNNGGRYDSDTDTWTPLSLASAPSARENAKAIWTGREMAAPIASFARSPAEAGRRSFWGGSGQPTPLNTGAIYDP